MGGALGRPAAVEVVEERGEDWHRAQAQFRVVDEDGSGRLDKEEVAGLLDMLGMGRLAGVELDAAMLAMDADGSGEVEFDEFFDWWKIADAREAQGKDAFLRGDDEEEDDETRPAEEAAAEEEQRGPGFRERCLERRCCAALAKRWANARRWTCGFTCPRCSVRVNVTLVVSSCLSVFAISNMAGIKSGATPCTGTISTGFGSSEHCVSFLAASGLSADARASRACPRRSAECPQLDGIPAVTEGIMMLLSMAFPLLAGVVGLLAGKLKVSTRTP